MVSTRWFVLGLAYVAGTISGLVKQMEPPQLVSIFERAGVPPELLSLFGAAEFVLALALLFPRARPTSAVLMAAMFSYTTYLLWPLGLSVALVYGIVMVPVVLIAGFWTGGTMFRDDGYHGATPIGLSRSRR